ncbi:MAG: UbiD family decarboxylase [Anaerolineae bacterium]|nr:UbiD family decarboxylase [Anaerolineae bacterium]
MNLRDLLTDLRNSGDLAVIQRTVDPAFEMASIIRALGDRAVLFERVAGYETPVAANLCARRAYLARALGVPAHRLLFALAEALAHPRQPRVVGRAPCQQVVEPRVDLGRLPILTHMERDGGPYVTAGALFTRDPDLGPNVAIHRLMRIDGRRFAARLVEQRGTHTAWTKSEGDLPVAICVGLPLHVLLASAMSPPKGVDELTIAQALCDTPFVRCRTSDLLVPAESEWVLEGRLTHDLTPEGPFVDLTETYDIVRMQPVIEIDCITHRRDAIYQALLPGLAEHKLLMGMPREPTIYAAVNEVCRCTNVCLTPGGMSWLHAVIQIDKQRPEDGALAIAKAFEGHSSLKHAVVVDLDVDPFRSDEVEWAIATRFQADRDLFLFRDQPSSSLDPSATHVPGQKARTSKMGLDATVPWVAPDGQVRDLEARAEFLRVDYAPVDLADYVGPALDGPGTEGA